MRLGRLFGRRKDDDPAARERLRALAAEALGNPDGLDLTISEIDCADPSCPGLETVILVMRPDQPTVAARIRKPIAAIGPADLKTAFAHL